MRNKLFCLAHLAGTSAVTWTCACQGRGSVTTADAQRSASAGLQASRLVRHWCMIRMIRDGIGGATSCQRMARQGHLGWAVGRACTSRCQHLKELWPLWAVPMCGACCMSGSCLRTTPACRPFWTGRSISSTLQLMSAGLPHWGAALWEPKVPVDLALSCAILGAAVAYRPAHARNRR